MNAALEIFDLALDFVAAGQQRNAQDYVTAGRAGQRGRELIRKVTDAFFAKERRQALEGNLSVDLRRRARRQQARREEIALARRQQVGAGEQVDVLIENLTELHHQ